MQTIQSKLPCLELRQYVRAYAQREIVDSSIDVVQPMPASLESIIELDFGNPPIGPANSFIGGVSQIGFYGPPRTYSATLNYHY